MTGLPKWRDAADHTFRAFLRPGPRSGPYILDVDSAGYYWLQEWPFAGMQPDDTLNGHNTSSYGIYEYYLVTHDARAKALFRAARDHGEALPPARSAATAGSAATACAIASPTRTTTACTSGSSSSCTT